MDAIMDGMEALLVDAHKTKGWHWVCSEPLWNTWPMERFGASIPSVILCIRNPTLLRQLLQSLTSSGLIGVLWNLHAELLDTLRGHDVSFESSRKITNTLVEQLHLEEDSWDAKWE